MLRIGITQRVQALAERGERRDCLDQAWIPLLESIGAVGVAIPNRASSVGGFIDALGLDGVIFSDGNDLAHLPEPTAPAPERDACERKILDFSGERGLPVLGVCRGLQVMASHYGGAVARLDGHAAAPHALHVVDGGPLALQPREVVNSDHDWGLHRVEVPDELRVAATAPDGSVEAIYHPRFAQAAIMWHPERHPYDPRDAALMRDFFEQVR